MPTEAWYLLIVCGLIVVVVALVKGRGLTITKKLLKVDAAPQDHPQATVSVAPDVKIMDSQAGRIVGVSTSGSAPPPLPSIDVLRGGTVERSRIGDIIGAQHERPKS